MRRKLFVLCLFLLQLTLGFSSIAFAENKTFEKMSRGLTNIVTSPIEIPKQFRAGWIEGSEKTPHILVWLLCGTVKGTVNMVGRVGSGMWDVATSICPKAKYDEPLMKPASVFDQWPVRETKSK